MTSLPPERRSYVIGKFGQVHIREQGYQQQASIPLLLVHQTPWSSLQYLRTAPLLAAGGFHTIAPDSPGYGLSDPPQTALTLTDYADNLAIVLDKLGLARAAIAGHHTGAMIALIFAARYPDRTLAVVTDNAPFYTPEERTERLARAPQAYPLKPDGSHFTDRWSLMRRISDPEMSNEMVNLAVLTFFNNELIKGSEKDLGHAAAFQHDLAADLPAISAPTLIIASRNDPIFASGRRLTAMRPDFAYQEFPGGTATVLESPQLWAKTIGAFITANN